MRAKSIYKTYNTQTKSYETFDATKSQPGQTVIKMFWSETAKRHMVVPGASLYTVNADGQMELTD